MKRHMKYLFINTVAGTGSTGRIATDKCRELMAQGHECILAYGRYKNGCEDIETYRIGTDLDNKLHGIYTRFFDKHGLASTNATRKFLKWADEYNPDVVWLHNIHGYYLNFELLFRWIKAHLERKVIWTLHDCWAVTGHCSHFTAVKCDKWKTGCEKCPQKDRYPKSLFVDNSKDNYWRKKEAFCGVKRMKLIVPSHWLESVVKESFLKEYETEVVYNTIDTNIFKPTSSNFREKYGLQDKKIILGVANVWDERKGLNDFVKLSQMLDERYAIVLVGISKKQMRKLPKEIKAFERVEHIEELAMAYSAADIYVNPSVEETFGMTTAEAQACGTKAVVYQGTACEEVVQHVEGSADSIKGIAIPPDVNSLYKCITNILGRGIDSGV